MKSLRNKMLLPSLWVMGLFLAGVQAPHAASAFNSSATLTYTIDSIAFVGPPVTGLTYQVSFQQDGIPGYYDYTTGDGAVIADNPSVTSPIVVGNPYSHSFFVSGSVTDGLVSTSHLGQFSLDFNNSGAGEYDIQVTLDYQLNASASGANADSDVSLDYYNIGFSFSGSERLNASVSDLPVTALSGSVVYSFILAANASQSLYGDVVINGNLQASPVPLPAAAWLFVSGILGVLGLARRSKV